MLVSSLFGNSVPPARIKPTDGRCPLLFGQELQQARQDANQEDPAAPPTLIAIIVQQLGEIFWRYSPERTGGFQDRSNYPQKNLPDSLPRQSVRDDRLQQSFLVFPATQPMTVPAAPANAFATSPADTPIYAVSAPAAEQSLMTGGTNAIPSAQKAPAPYFRSRKEITYPFGLPFCSRHGLAVAPAIAKAAVVATVVIPGGHAKIVGGEVMPSVLPDHSQKLPGSTLRNHEVFAGVTLPVVKSSPQAGEAVFAESDSNKPVPKPLLGEVLSVAPPASVSTAAVATVDCVHQQPVAAPGHVARHYYPAAMHSGDKFLAQATPVATVRQGTTPPSAPNADVSASRSPRNAVMATPPPVSLPESSESRSVSVSGRIFAVNSPPQLANQENRDNQQLPSKLEQIATWRSPAAMGSGDQFLPDNVVEKENAPAAINRQPAASETGAILRSAPTSNLAPQQPVTPLQQEPGKVLPASLRPDSSEKENAPAAINRQPAASETGAILRSAPTSNLAPQQPVTPLQQEPGKVLPASLRPDSSEKENAPAAINRQPAASETGAILRSAPTSNSAPPQPVTPLQQEPGKVLPASLRPDSSPVSAPTSNSAPPQPALTPQPRPPASAATTAASAGSPVRTSVNQEKMAASAKTNGNKEPEGKKSASCFSNSVSRQGTTNAHSLSSVIEERRSQEAKGQSKWVIYFFPAPKVHPRPRLASADMQLSGTEMATPAPQPAIAASSVKAAAPGEFAQNSATPAATDYGQEIIIPTLQNIAVQIEHEQAQIQIQMKMQGRDLQAELRVDEAALFDSLQNNLGQLRESLWQSGINAERIEIFLSNDNSTAFSDSRSHHNSWRQPLLRRNIDYSPGSPGVAEITLSARPEHRGQLSYYV